MAQSTTSTSRKIWRTVLTGAAAVPFAVFAAAPAVGAVGAEPAETANVEQLPPAPGPGVPDPTLLLDLQTCLSDLQAALGGTAPVPPAPADGAQPEQLPAPPAQLPPTQAPDLAAMVETCQTLLETVQGTAPPAPAPAEDPVAPKPQDPVG